MRLAVTEIKVTQTIDVRLGLMNVVVTEGQRRWLAVCAKVL
jgi:hypothetical protein